MRVRDILVLLLSIKERFLLKAKLSIGQDVHSLLTIRSQYRCDRRFRKTRYRRARFLNCKKAEDWLPPSIMGKLNANFAWIDTFCSLVSNPKLRIEVRKFDTAKIINPEIHGIDYQHGQHGSILLLRKYNAGIPT